MSDESLTYSGTASSTVTGIVYSLRPWQWYKQLIIFVPVVFSFQYFDPLDVAIWLRVVVGATVFSLTAGCVYIVNDIMDIKEDRNHPRKKHRPIASGRVSVAVAAGVAFPGLVAGPAVGWVIDPAFGFLLVVYVVQNALYSVGLKDYIFVDLLILGVGFVIRAIAGVVLVGAPISPWLVLCTFLTALLLGTGKRRAELGSVENGEDIRQSLDDYSGELLQVMFISVCAVLLVSYSLYTFFVRSDAMMLTIPFALYAVFRYGYLTIEKGMKQPERMFVDRPMMVNLLLWALVTFAVLYFLPVKTVDEFQAIMFS
ncbi:decaprenyl-phosphate phosphoribosyltransferase [Salinigranum rubrum]|uniref:Decaprenyl-phosphate phosphoribosyltransferase n=1 Tax=Salinigranum rubrum TaxID=755307 RepID=A0A2I8VKT8_9EURY|nr:UbiA prenyltransferase family protein [Salinigranum rubrum]AUV82528.1 decaprenyl-phosphate phosphoribosyltransferase [Salinigranum rubrum]